MSGDGGNQGRPGVRSAIERGELSSARPTKPFRLVDSLWRNLPLVLAAGLPLFLVFSLLTLPLTRPIYEVAGRLMINPIKQPVIGTRDRDVIEGDVGVFQRTLTERLLNREVIEDALRKLPDERRPAFIKGKGESDSAIYSLMSRIDVRGLDRTYLIDVRMSSGSPQGLAESLTAVLESFMRKLEAEQQRSYASRLGHLIEERGNLLDNASAQSRQLLDLAAGIEDKSFLLDTFTAHLSKVEGIQKQYWIMKAAALDKQAAYEEARRNRESLPGLSLQPFADERVSDNYGINQIEFWTYGQSQELRANIDGLTPNNPDRQYVEQRMEAMNDYLDDYKKRVREQTIANLRAKREFELDAEVLKARNAYNALEESTAELGRQLEQAIGEASRVSEAIFRTRELAHGLDDVRDRISSINVRIDDTQMLANAPLPVSIDQYPERPGEPTSTNAAKLQLFALVASFGLVAGVLFGMDYLDGRIRCRQHLGAAIGGQGCEPVPATSRDGEDERFPQLLVERPRHPAALPLRELALRLLLEHQRAGARVVALASTHRAAGATGIALNVARALTGHGLRVLLVELPCPQPRLAAYAGLGGVAPPQSGWAGRHDDPHSPC